MKKMMDVSLFWTMFYCVLLVLDSWCSGIDHRDSQVGLMSSSIYTEVRLILVNTAAVVQMEVH